MNKLLGALAAVVFMFSPVAAQTQKTINFITQPPGGSWYSYGSTFAEIIASSDGPFDIHVEVLPRGGGMANPVAVNQGVADIGFVSTNGAVWARDGIGKEFKGRESTNITAIAGGLQITYTTAIARKAYVEQTGNDSFDKLLAAKNLPRMVMKPTGSQVPLIADFMFQARGTSLEALRGKGAIVQVEVAQISQMLRDGTVDVYIENAPLGQASMTEVTLTSDMVFLPMSDTVLTHMNKLGLPTGTLPAGSYNGLDFDYVNPTSPTILIANRNLDENLVYEITRALVENREKIAKAYSALATWDPQAGAQLNQTAIALHPGAARYYRERGWIN